MNYARLGAMRLNFSRLDYFQPWVKVLINGADRTANVRIDGAEIQQTLDGTPSTATIVVSGLTPTKGQDVKIYLGDQDARHLLFGGNVQEVAARYEDAPANTVYTLSCVDYTARLNARKVIKRYTSQSATAIVLDLMASFTSGFTTANVATGLATLDEITFTDEDVTDALDRLAERIGGYWYLDYGKDLHVFLSSADAAFTVTDTPAGMGIENESLSYSVDLSQARTRVWSRGGGSTAAVGVDAGSTTLPVDDAVWYSGAGGKVQSGPQRITYTGKQSGGTGSSTGYITPPGQLGAGAVGGAGTGSLSSGTYLCALTYVTAEGETTPGPTQSVVVSGSTRNISFFGVPAAPDPKITTIRGYITDAGGSQLKKYGDFGTAGGSVQFTTTGTTNAPTTNTAGFGSLASAAGSTTLPVEDCAQFLAAGGWAIAPGGQIFRYSGRSASSGPGNLTGIPASGTGSLASAVRSGTVTTLPHLTGVSGIAYAINAGDEVNVLTQHDDATAQTNLAGWLGSGDGIVEDAIADGRLSLTETSARGAAKLAQLKDPLETVSWETRDQSVRPGRSIMFTVTSPAVSTTLKIQRVTITDLQVGGSEQLIFPMRRAEASSRRVSFESLVRQLRNAQGN